MQVRAVAGIVEERLASHVKKELRDIVAPAIADAVQRALQRKAANEHMLTQVGVMNTLPQPAHWLWSCHASYIVSDGKL